jgi:hypothetical protein
MGVALRVLAVAALAYLALVVAGWLLWGRR